ncbi:hypothetical protein IQ215_08850 [Cyanobacterium stanieri LEGE 03274]|uniref:Molecular chaperone DnaJ n=1 Tax=Cyanobacterium stanieri LEGE 03274 TaxID=1828756 RepID=A0ABR9V4J4_9CHRO|nr:hypothetical protein [Cyanobacterium stanieri]MBE9222803.1 hypothetical protein [Cyanobacterium stanieri LEGE 03274]
MLAGFKIKVCPICRGSGKILVREKNPSYTGVKEYHQKTCNHCQGKGIIDS